MNINKKSVPEQEESKVEQLAETLYEYLRTLDARLKNASPEERVNIFRERDHLAEMIIEIENTYNGKEGRIEKDLKLLAEDIGKFAKIDTALARDNETTEEREERILAVIGDMSTDIGNYWPTQENLTTLLRHRIGNCKARSALMASRIRALYPEVNIYIEKTRCHDNKHELFHRNLLISFPWDPNVFYRIDPPRSPEKTEDRPLLTQPPEVLMPGEFVAKIEGEFPVKIDMDYERMLQCFGTRERFDGIPHHDSPFESQLPWIDLGANGEPLDMSMRDIRSPIRSALHSLRMPAQVVAAVAICALAAGVALDFYEEGRFDPQAVITELDDQPKREAFFASLEELPPEVQKAVQETIKDHEEVVAEAEDTPDEEQEEEGDLLASTEGSMPAESGVVDAVAVDLDEDGIAPRAKILARIKNPDRSLAEIVGVDGEAKDHITAARIHVNEIGDVVIAAAYDTGAASTIKVTNREDLHAVAKKAPEGSRLAKRLRKAEEIAAAHEDYVANRMIYKYPVLSGGVNLRNLSAEIIRMILSKYPPVHLEMTLDTLEEKIQFTGEELLEDSTRSPIKRFISKNEKLGKVKRFLEEEEVHIIRVDQQGRLILEFGIPGQELVITHGGNGLLTSIILHNNQLRNNRWVNEFYFAIRNNSVKSQLDDKLARNAPLNP